MRICLLNAQGHQVNNNYSGGGRDSFIVVYQGHSTGLTEGKRQTSFIKHTLAKYGHVLLQRHRLCCVKQNVFSLQGPFFIKLVEVTRQRHCGQSLAVTADP